MRTPGFFFLLKSVLIFLIVERVADISLMREELADEINHMHMEIDNLKEYKRTLERALEDSSKPLHIGQECLMHREKRYGIDMVHDDVEKSLIRQTKHEYQQHRTFFKSIEPRTIFGCVLLDSPFVERRECPYIDKRNYEMNRAALHSLDVDMKDKEHAQSIDDRMHHLRNSSAGIGYYPGIEHVSNTDACLRQCANAMWCQFNTVNNSFNSRIRETTDTRNKMQAHLQKILQEIFDTEKSIDLLRKAIQKKEGPMKVAQTRLEERNYRVNVELCNDPAMKVLQREVTEIRESVKVLHDKLRNAEAALARLVKTRSTLENDINVKENSLQIDSKFCMGMRKSFPMEPNIGPIFQMPLDI
eukprot:XP_014791323.1 PREDICTED: tektin-3-like [Octopus bimaculoides]